MLSLLLQWLYPAMLVLHIHPCILSPMAWHLHRVNSWYDWETVSFWTCPCHNMDILLSISLDIPYLLLASACSLCKAPLMLGVLGENAIDGQADHGLAFPCSGVEERKASQSCSEEHTLHTTSKNACPPWLVWLHIPQIQHSRLVARPPWLVWQRHSCYQKHHH